MTACIKGCTNASNCYKQCHLWTSVYCPFFLGQEIFFSFTRALSFNSHIQILHTDVHKFPWTIIWKNLLQDQRISPLVIVIIMYGYCQEKIDVGHSGFKGIRIAIFITEEPHEWKCYRMGPTVFRPYPRTLKDLTTCRDETIKQYLLLSYLNTLSVGLAEIDLLLWILVLNFLHKPGGAVIQKVHGEWDDMRTCMVLLAATVSSSSSLSFFPTQ